MAAIPTILQFLIAFFGAYFVALAPISDPALVATTIATTLGVSRASIYRHLETTR